MIPDHNLVFSDGQVLTATAVSANVLDMGIARDLGEPPGGLNLVIQFGGATAPGGATFSAMLRGADDAAIGVNVVNKDTTPTFTPAANTRIVRRIPTGVPKRYWRLDYTITGGAGPSIPVTAMILTDAELRASQRVVG